MKISIVTLNSKDNVIEKFTLGEKIIPVTNEIYGDMRNSKKNYSISKKSKSYAWLNAEVMYNIRCESNNLCKPALYIEDTDTHNTFVLMPDYRWYTINDTPEKIKLPKFIKEYRVSGVVCHKNCKNRRGKECIKCDRLQKAQIIQFKIDNYVVCFGYGDNINKFFIEICYEDWYLN